jgi:hypothetical protein
MLRNLDFDRQYAQLLKEDFNPAPPNFVRYRILLFTILSKTEKIRKKNPDFSRATILNTD